MKVHFVCTGNYYRSRLAEAYLNSKLIPNLEVSSSGIMSDYYYNENGPISWYAMRLLDKYNLISFMKKLPTQTTENILKEQDLVIFMKNSHYLYAKNNFNFEGNDYDVWNILDMDEFEGYEMWNDLKYIDISEKTFEQIKDNINKLIPKLNT